MKVTRSVAAAALAAAAGCAPANRGTPGLTPIGSLTDTAAAMPTLSGNFSSAMNVATGAVAAGRAPRVDGTVRLVPSGTRSNQYTAEFNFTSERGAESLLWSVVPGDCGSGDLPLVSPLQNTRIDVLSNGRARLRAEFRGTITPGMDFHVNLYANDGTDLADVVACAALK